MTSVCGCTDVGYTDQTNRQGKRVVDQSNKKKGEEKITSTKKKQNLEWWISTQQKKDMYG